MAQKFISYSSHWDLGSVSSEKRSEVERPIRNLQEDQASFLWFRQMHEFMIALENDDDHKAKEEMLRACRKQYQHKNELQTSIDDFSTQSVHDNRKKAISLYTDDSFIHRCTNTALSKENIAQVYSYRYIIKLICQKLKELHREFIDTYKKRDAKNDIASLSWSSTKGRSTSNSSEQCSEFRISQWIRLNIKKQKYCNGFYSSSYAKRLGICSIQDRREYDKGI